ncbi:hypothetical protein HFO73_01060 [Rhizobium laguerreae]|uniref:hypothetical protein n=1 Tax=Rhizobium laguerreae TaxID=1076926 RepID=UPI001C90CBC6|nr:hypothetical protein [Rhizobium laguerreae]MBY3075844.1 hypothetical protein [Rhizobium laguerreae]
MAALDQTNAGAAIALTFVDNDNTGTLESVNHGIKSIRSDADSLGPRPFHIPHGVDAYGGLLGERLLVHPHKRPCRSDLISCDSQNKLLHTTSWIIYTTNC